MSVLHLDSDRLTDAARDSSWTSTETAHLAACAECRLELELVKAAGRLGRAEVASLAPAAIADAVRRRLAAAPRRSGLRTRAPWLLGLAAAAAVSLAVWYGSSRVSAPRLAIGSVSVELSVLHELDGLDEPELESVLESIPLAAGAVFHPEPAPLEELNVNDLERLLRSMEE